MVSSQIIHTSKHRTRPANLSTYSVNEEHNKAKFYSFMRLQTLAQKPIILWAQEERVNHQKSIISLHPVPASPHSLCFPTPVLRSLPCPSNKLRLLKLLLRGSERAPLAAAARDVHSVTTDCHQGTPRQPGKIREASQQEDIAFKVYCLLGPEMRGLLGNSSEEEGGSH